MINNSFYESKNNFRLIKGESVLIEKRLMDGEKNEFYWEIYYKNV